MAKLTGNSQLDYLAASKCIRVPLPTSLLKRL